MHLLVVGLSHKTTPIELREKLALTAESAVETARGLLGVGSINEAMALSTCNRVELYLAAEHSFSADAAAINAFADRAGTTTTDLRDHVYVHRDLDAVRHIFHVASSLDSMVVGEPQIIGQLKDAYRSASAIDAVGPQLDRALRQAFSVAKRVRNETSIGENAVSLAFLAVELGRHIFGKLKGKKALLLGAGEMSALAARHLSTHGAELTITNRSLSRAETLASELGGEARSLEALPELLTKADIVVSSTAATRWVLNYETVQGIMRARRNRPIFLIDLAVPRDIEPRVNTLDNVYLYDVDDLERVLEANRAARAQAAEAGRVLADQEAERFVRRMRQQEVVPAIVAIRERFHNITASEIENTLSRQNFTPAQIKAIRTLGKRVTNKLLHRPTVNLKEASESGDPGTLVDALTALFELEDGDEEGEERSEQTALEHLKAT